MKKIILLAAISSSLLALSQKNYTKISSSKVSAERVNVSENFINAYYKKCENKDYSGFSNFILDKRFERRFYPEFQESCEESIRDYGKIISQKFNSAYIYDYTKKTDPVELIIFEANFENSKDVQFISVWIYRDQNVIYGILVSKEKPFGKFKPKKEPTL